MRAPGPAAGWWLALLALALAWLLLVLVAAANPPHVDGGWLQRSWLTLHHSPIALAIGAFLGLVGFAYAVRRLMLRWLMWLPGAIEVPDFTPDETLRGDRSAAVPVEQLSMRFRERLAAGHLQAPDAFPSTPEQQDFLQLLASAARTPTNVLGTIVGLLTSMLPTSAYRVRGTLLRRAGAKPCGVAVQVIVAPRYGSTPIFVWETTWEAAVERAAYALAAYLLPRTRACRNSPWRTWQGIEMPPELVERGTQASEFAAAHRYDQALAAYFDAIDADPYNLELRFEVGLLQEKLALWLDAYATYHDLLAVAGTLRRERRRRNVRRAETRILLHARYRRAVLLGFGERLAAQWCKREQAANGNARRRAERRVTIERLAPEFDKELDAVGQAINEGDRGHASIAALATVLACFDGLDDAGAEVHLRELFAYSAKRQLHELADDLQRRENRRNAGGLTRRSVLVAAAWADLRAQYSRVLLGKRETLPTFRWVDEQVRRHVTRGTWRDWQASYNAACTYAVALVPDPRRVTDACPGGATTYGPNEHDDFARQAIAWLEDAVSQLDSGGLARRRAWIVSQDPDLAGLRRLPRFATFEARFFPSHSATPPRPTNVHYLELARYTTRLLRVAAHALSDVWREREIDCSRNGDPGDVSLLRWLDEECRAVARFARAAGEHRHWQTRASSLEDFRAWARAYERSLGSLAYLDYGVDPIPSTNAAAPQRASKRDSKAAERLTDLDEAMLEVARHCTPPSGGMTGTGPFAPHVEWLHAVKDATRTTPVTALCRDRARWWEWLSDVLNVEGDDKPTPRRPPVTSPHAPANAGGRRSVKRRRRSAGQPS